MLESWDFIETGDYPEGDLVRIACAALPTWNAEGRITEDLLQQTHLIFLTKISEGAIDRSKAPGGFFTSILRSLLLKDHARNVAWGAKREQLRQRREEEARGARSNIAETEDRLDYEKRCEQMHALADAHLWGIHRDRFLCHHVDGVSIKELAEDAGVTDAAVRTSLRASEATIREAQR